MGDLRHASFQQCRLIQFKKIRPDVPTKDSRNIVGEHPISRAHRSPPAFCPASFGSTMRCRCTIWNSNRSRGLAGDINNLWRVDGPSDADRRTSAPVGLAPPGRAKYHLPHHRPPCRLPRCHGQVRGQQWRGFGFRFGFNRDGTVRPSVDLSLQSSLRFDSVSSATTTRICLALNRRWW